MTTLSKRLGRRAIIPDNISSNRRLKALLTSFAVVVLRSQESGEVDEPVFRTEGDIASIRLCDRLDKEVWLHVIGHHSFCNVGKLAAPSSVGRRTRTQ